MGVKWCTVLPAIVGTLLLSGCVQNAPYHTSSGRPGNCSAAAGPTPEAVSCRQSYYQEHDNFDLAFAEFSERGNAFDDEHISNILHRIEARAGQQGVVLLVFVHGWKHNASEDDENVLEFKDTLTHLSAELTARFGSDGIGSRRLVGLYVGWRGASIDLPWVEQITFWDRKAAAEEVGRGGVTRLLLDLGQATDSQPENVMVVIGHSFGGAIVVSALSEVLTERIIQRRQRMPDAVTVGDGVIVLNPAIEANQLLPLVEAAIQEDYRPEQYPLFVSLSSDADRATHWAFPFGQTLGRWIGWRQASLARSYYYDRLEPGQELPLEEKHLDATAVGNFAPFLTHRISASGEGDDLEFTVMPCGDAPEGCTPAGWTMLSGQPAIRDLPENYPLFFYKTDDTLMDGHNDIFNRRVRSFVMTVIDEIVARELARADAIRSKRVASPAPSMLNEAEVFERRLKEVAKDLPVQPVEQRGE